MTRRPYSPRLRREEGEAPIRDQLVTKTCLRCDKKVRLPPRFFLCDGCRHVVGSLFHPQNDA